MCRICGTDLRPRHVSKGPSKKCPFCEAENQLDAIFCSSCNKYLGGTPDKMVKTDKAKEKKEKYYDRTYVDYPSSAMRTARAGLGGILMMMVAIFTFVDIAFTFGVGWEITQMEDYDQLIRENPELKSAIPNLMVCETLRVVFACFALLGAFMAMQRMNFGLSVLGGVFSIFAVSPSVMAFVSFTWLLLVGLFFLMAVLGLVLVVISHREFMLK